MFITDLGGHSGCRIQLGEKNNCFFVRKVSASIDYNSRLKIQAEKQENFQNPRIKVPALFDMGYTDDDLFYFDMEYIQGITLAEYMKVIEVGKLRNLVEMIVSNLSICALDNNGCDEMVFINKLASLKKLLMPLDNPIINDAFGFLEGHSWDRFSLSACHGDLTLENIIVKDNQLYFIDFLDSFYDCWLLDISTLLQDVQVMWSYRSQRDVDINTLIRLIIFRDILIDEIREIDPKFVSEVYFALLLKLVRIYPYTKDKLTYDFLNEKAQSVMEIIRKDELDI